MADNDDMAGIYEVLAETAQQINEDVTTRHRAAAIAHRQGQQVEQRALNNSMPAEQPKKPVNLAPKGIPMSLIIRSDREEGEPVKFAPGELQVEEAKQEAAETRLPTLPMLPAIESSCKGSGLECEQLEHDQRETWEALGTSAYEERKCSTLETSAGFYLKCKNFLPVATPEQHFRVFGLSRPLSKEEWEDFKNDAQASGDAG